MYSRLFVWENCIVVISMTLEIDLRWRSVNVLMGSPMPSKDLHFYYITRSKAKWEQTPSTSTDLIECIQMWFIEQLHSHSTSPRCNCFAYNAGFSCLPHPLANTPTPFKLEIGLAFVEDTEEESIGALITAIHYPNKHGTQPLLDTNSGDIKCLARDKGPDRESLLH